MGSSTSPGERSLPRAWPAGATVWCAFLIAASLFTPAAARADWHWSPELRLSGGDESNLVIDPGAMPTIVPGGSFVEAAPALSLRHWGAGKVAADLGVFATWQQFFNDDDRLLSAYTASGDVYHRVARHVRLRASGSANFFDDTGRDTARRLGAGGELGATFLTTYWSAEIYGGTRGRRYPNVTIADSSGASTDEYTEQVWSSGLTLRVVPHPHIDARLGGAIQTTNASDNYYESSSWTVSGDIDLRPVHAVSVTLSGLVQQRDYDQRVPGFDTDDYWQAGAGLGYHFGGGWWAIAQYAYSEYTWPDGDVTDTERLAIGIRFTRPQAWAPSPPRVDMSKLEKASGGSVQASDAGGSVLLRVRADGASHVHVAGDFNDWDVTSTPMRAGQDGWWEVRLSLEPGSYQYVYVIDGRWTTPPEAISTVDDGFGGRNGILEVLSPEA